MLPLFVHDILLGDVDGSWRQLLSTHIQSFFSQYRRPSTPTSRPTTPMLSDSGAKPFVSHDYVNNNLVCCSAALSETLYSEHFFLSVLTGNSIDAANQSQIDKTSLRSMLAVIDYLRQQSRPVAPGRLDAF